VAILVEVKEQERGHQIGGKQTLAVASGRLNVGLENRRMEPALGSRFSIRVHLFYRVDSGRQPGKSPEEPGNLAVALHALFFNSM
jgi:hypothetical protein